jgi:hypothetical protein
MTPAMRQGWQTDPVSLSLETLALVTDIACAREIDIALINETDLLTLFDRAGLPCSPSEAQDRKFFLAETFRFGHTQAVKWGDADAGRALIKTVESIITRLEPDPENAPAWFSELRDALRADGYELSWSPGGPPIYGIIRATAVPAFTFSLLPTDATPVPLGPEISALEVELKDRGYTTALKAYEDAVDSLVNHRHESANRDLRTAFEDLVTQLAIDHAGYQKPAKANTGTDAINLLVKDNRMNDRDGGRMVQGLWQMIQTRGPHPGSSDPDEARCRMQLVTATARFLLRSFPTQP